MDYDDDTAITALETVLSAGIDGILPLAFAKAMWPDSPLWRGRTRAGTPAPSGRIVTAAGGMLGRLRLAGLTKRWGEGRYARHFLTELGEEFLRSAKERARHEAR